MNITSFKEMVAEYMNRDQALFGTGVDGKTDRILGAANMAKAWAQRTYKFERTRAQASLTVDKTTGASLTGAVKYGTTTPVIVRSIQKAFLQSADGTGLVPIDVITRDAQVARLQRSIEQVSIEDRRANSAAGPNYLSVVQQGQTLYLWPWPSVGVSGGVANIVLDIFEFLPEYSDTITSDFFLVECLDWMLFRTITHLNLYLKEEQRIVITARAMDEAWQAVKDWDTSLVLGTAPVDLD